MRSLNITYAFSPYNVSSRGGRPQQQYKLRALGGPKICQLEEAHMVSVGMDSLILARDWPQMEFLNMVIERI